jgi:putative transposase
MGISRTTFYNQLRSQADDTAISIAIAAICDELEHYGWRRVRAALRQQGMTVHHKKIR